jgi:prepilin-type N-terminal cleavage/methylation domain-containing protein
MAMTRLTAPTGKAQSGGFTLLEVLMATSLLAVGAVSVLVVLATAAGYASQRQSQQRLTQVLEEARNSARTMVNSFVPSEDDKLPGKDDEPNEEQQSMLYPGFTYQLTFAPVDKDVPEAGFEVGVTVRFGDGQERTEVLVVGSDAVPDEEFSRSETYELEREGEADEDTGGRETR